MRCSADYSVTLNKAALIVGAGKVSPATVGMLAAAYMCLVMLAVFINSLSLRLPLIYYKQRRSKVQSIVSFACLPACIPGPYVSICQLVCDLCARLLVIHLARVSLASGDPSKLGGLGLMCCTFPS